MKFDLVSLNVPVKKTKHLALQLENNEHVDVFVTLCTELADVLQDIEDSIERRREINEFLTRWSLFFQHYSIRGLSPEKQRGLVGELLWLKRLLKGGLDCAEVIDSWKGCGRAYHDFDVNGHVVEVKTTLSKEPRKVFINNERQLDDTGLVSLHLHALSLIKSGSGGDTLPDTVYSIRELLSSNSNCRNQFEKSLIKAGYMDTQADLYKDSYTVKKEELFEIRDEFPRITELPSGLGDIKYSLVLSACRDYACDIDEYIKTDIIRNNVI